MRLITSDDFYETFSKATQRGISYLLSKLSFSALARTRSTFDDTALRAANWWILPEMKQRWNEKITGSRTLAYEPYVVKKYLRGRSGLRLLSLGSGGCSHELTFAAHPEFAEVTCVDIAATLLAAAEQQARAAGLTNMRFLVADANALALPAEAYDVVLFHSALHHFENVPGAVHSARRALRPGGLLVLNDYVGPNRLQWTAAQVAETNRILREVMPPAYKVRFMSQRLKTSVSGPGWLRMLLSDPSEAVQSEKILPAVHAAFETLEEKAIGGNVLTLLLKDIAHHFLLQDAATQALLARLCELEDQFLTRESSNLIFGVYRKPEML